MIHSLLINSKAAFQGLACNKGFYWFPQKVVRKQNLWFIDHLILQCINFIRYLGKDVGAPEQELLGEHYKPSFHTNEHEDPRVNVQTSFVGAGTYVNECKQPLSLALWTWRLLSDPSCCLWNSALHEPSTTQSQQMLPKKGYLTHPSAQNMSTQVLVGNKREEDGNYPGLLKYHGSSRFLWPSPSCPIIYTGNFIRFICSNKSVKWTGFGSRENLIKPNKPFS